MHLCYVNKSTPTIGQQERGGFVLLMVLVLVTVAAVSLAGIARQSLALAQQAASAQESLQRRWGVISCERVLLSQAEELLEQKAAQFVSEDDGWPLPASVTADFTLGQLRFSAVLADDDAKVNLNAIYRRSPNSVNGIVTSMLHSAYTHGLRTRIILPAESEKDRESIPFRSWGQVFEPTGVSNDVETAWRMHNATQEVSCWGGGRLNIRRSSDEAIRVVCESQVSRDVVRKLLEARSDPEVEALDELIPELALKVSDRTTLRRLLTDQSQCHSLWIFVRGDHRDWARLVVDHPGQDSGSKRQTFTW